MQTQEVAELKRRVIQADNEVTCQLTMAMISFRWGPLVNDVGTVYSMPYNCLQAAHDLAKMGASTLLIWPGGGSSGWWFWRR